MVRGEGETILVVEDEDDLRAYTTEALNDLGYRVLEAETAVSAIKLLEQEEDIALLFTDVVLTGGTNGRAIADEVCAAAGPPGAVHDGLHQKRDRPPRPAGPRHRAAREKLVYLLGARVQGSSADQLARALFLTPAGRST